MKDRTPFTYSLYCIPTGQYYYGSRYGKGCHPSQLWETYYTSSKEIASLIEVYGKEQFIARVRKVFETDTEARNWEYKFLMKVDAANNPLWLNKHNGGKNFMKRRGHKLSQETKDKLSAMHKGKPRPWVSVAQMGNQHNKGRQFSDEWLRKMSESKKGNQNRTGIPHSEEIKKLISERTSAALKGVPKKRVTCPHCGKEGGEGNMKRYHFDNCKSM